jgi:hypothetical protein
MISPESTKPDTKELRRILIFLSRWSPDGNRMSIGTRTGFDEWGCIDPVGSVLPWPDESKDLHGSVRRSQACTCHQSLFASRAQRFTALPVVRGLSFARFELPVLCSQSIRNFDLGFRLARTYP